jgi:hypothetical protein
MANDLILGHAIGPPRDGDTSNLVFFLTRAPDGEAHSFPGGIPRVHGPGLRGALQGRVSPWMCVRFFPGPDANALLLLLGAVDIWLGYAIWWGVSGGRNGLICRVPGRGGCGCRPGETTHQVG